MLGLIAWAVLLSSPGPFVLANGSSAGLEQIVIRQSDEKSPWKALGPGALAPGARISLPSPGGELCAFDIRAKVGAETLTWANVNLCDVKVVTLRRRADGTRWVDYD
jgi:hypothetical protein